MSDFAPILILLVVVAIVVARLPKVDLGHSPEFLRRRVLNWLPLGMTYAFLYMGRYNLTAAKIALGATMTKQDFGTISTYGSIVYGVAFVLNGPLTDRFGGRAAILASAGGAAIMNVAMGLFTWGMLTKQSWAVGMPVVGTFSVLYALNMYFQSFGAVSIVKVNASWFHLRERGTFGGIFGILISLGVYFAYDWSARIAKAAPDATWWVFFVPAAILAVLWVVDFFAVRDTPREAGQRDFDLGDASSGDTGPQLGALHVAKLMLRNPVILTIAGIEFFSGFLRNAIMPWYPIFAKELGLGTSQRFGEAFVSKNWGMLLCCAGILGGVVAGIISDRVFDSRRGPVASLLYAGMLLGALIMTTVLGSPMLGWLVVVMSLLIIGVHGMLSGTASMDFGGRRNVGVAVGLIDGCVYLGTAAQYFILGNLLPKEGLAESKDPSNWTVWPLAMIPAALIGLILATRVWNARAKPKSVVTPATDVSPGAPMGTELDTSKPLDAKSDAVA